MTTAQVANQLGIKVGQLVSWIEHGALPSPSFVDSNGVRYFDQGWIKKAREIVKSKKGT